MPMTDEVEIYVLYINMNELMKYQIFLVTFYKLNKGYCLI